jgi:hypothetical protein
LGTSGNYGNIFLPAALSVMKKLARFQKISQRSLKNIPLCVCVSIKNPNFLVAAQPPPYIIGKNVLIGELELQQTCVVQGTKGTKYRKMRQNTVLDFSIHIMLRDLLIQIA